MKKIAWVVAAFAAGMIVTATAARVKADTVPVPGWVRPGSCVIVAGGGGVEVIVELQLPWARIARAEAGPVRSEQWRNLAVAQWIQRQPDEDCRAAR